MMETRKGKRLERLGKAVEYKKRLNEWSLANDAGMLNGIQAEAAKMDREIEDITFLPFLDVRTAYRASLQTKITELTAAVEKRSKQSTVLDRRLGEVIGAIAVENIRADEASNFDSVTENLSRNPRQNPSALRKQQRP